MSKLECASCGSTDDAEVTVCVICGNGFCLDHPNQTASENECCSESCLGTFVYRLRIDVRAAHDELKAAVGATRDDLKAAHDALRRVKRITETVDLKDDMAAWRAIGEARGCATVALIFSGGAS